MPLTLEHLSDRAISLRHAQILVGHIVGLDADSVRQLEAAVLNRGMQQSPPQFERSVQVIVEKLNRATGVERQAEAAENSITWVEPMRDGMGRYVSEAPIVQIIAINNYVTDVAKSMQGDGETRTLTQLKTDVACDLLLNLDGVETTTVGRGNRPVNRMRSIRPKVLVTVPAMTLLRRGPRVDANGVELPQEPGILEGYGPISPQTAREIAANAKSMIRILTHPETGVTLYTTTSPTCAPDTKP